MKKRIIKNLLRQVQQLEDEHSRLVLENEALRRAVIKNDAAGRVVRVAGPIKSEGGTFELFTGSPPGHPDQTPGEVSKGVPLRELFRPETAVGSGVISGTSKAQL